MRGAWRGKAEQLRDLIPDAKAAADGAHTSAVLECLANLVEHASSIPSTAWKDRASPAARHTSPAVNLRQPRATDPMLQFLGDNVTEALLLLLQSSKSLPVLRQSSRLLWCLSRSDGNKMSIGSAGRTAVILESVVTHQMDMRTTSNLLVTLSNLALTPQTALSMASQDIFAIAANVASRHLE
ncbi:unnamed protein product, partial [Symbiodinium sp. KB8]